MSVRSYFDAALRDEWDGIGRITRDIRPADLVTMGNAIVGLVAIVAAARGELVLASLLVLVGILLDGLDGAVARLGGGGGPLGGFLDSLADTISFAVAPAVLLAIGLDVATWQSGATAGFFLVCVTLRLARFEALREQPPRRYFSGLSSPGGALVVVAAFLARLPAAWTLAVAVGMGVVMVSRIRYPKLRGWLGLVAMLLILAVLVSAAVGRYEMEVVAAMLAFMVVYLVAGPFYVLARFGATQHPDVD